jgi:hypothetical protein
MPLVLVVLFLLVTICVDTHCGLAQSGLLVFDALTT